MLPEKKSGWSEADEKEFQKVRDQVEGWKKGSIAMSLDKAKDLQKVLRDMKRKKPKERKAYPREGLVYTTLDEALGARLEKWLKGGEGRTKADAIRTALDRFLPK